MKTSQYLAAALAAEMLFPPLAGAQPAPPAPTREAIAACAAMASPQNGARFALITDAPTAIKSAQVIPAGGTHGVADNDLPEYCRVEGQIAPTVGFLLRMPTKTWNGKFMMGGCGGACGDYLEDRIDPALARNYAVVDTDMGHKGVNWLFAYNNPQGQIDFAYRSTHLTANVAKELVAFYYGRKASRNYYMGCSTGGRQGMIEAQRFPTDFEGIIDGAPVYDEIGDAPYFLEWNVLVNRRPDGGQILNVDKLPVIHKTVLDQCDALDGLKDGILQNPGRCAFDPKSIVCKAGQDAASCLTPEQADVARKIHEGARNSKGEKLYWGMPWGSEDQWAGLFISADGRSRVTRGASITSIMGFGVSTTDYDIDKFDYDRDPARIAMQGAIFNPTNPDLSAFRQAGGKMILYHGWNDNNIPVEASISYYQAAMRANGGEAATKAFFRFFTPPAINHCRNGLGGGEADWITALENWVEKGQAPDEVIAYHPIKPYETAPRAIEDYGVEYSKLGRHPMNPATYDRARPVYAYPGVAHYSGKGDPALPSSWVKAAE